MTEEDCQRVREHVAELRMAGFHPGGLSDEKVEVEKQKHIANFSRLGGKKALDECVANKNLAWVQCVLDATDLRGVSACD